MDRSKAMSEKKKRGRHEIEIDFKKLELLSQLGCTNKEIAAHFNVSERTIDTRRRNEEFREVMDRAEALGNISLRRKQMTMALNGDRTMLIWLGKQRLGQKDKVEQTGRVEKITPPKIHVNFVTPKKDDEES